MIDYSRQSQLKGFEVPPVATVVGCGAVGSWASYFLALAGVPRLIIYALGPVKPTGLARLPFGEEMVGRPYQYAIAHLLFGIRPSITLDLHSEFIAEASKIEGLVLNCAASTEISFDPDLKAQADRAGIPYFVANYTSNSVSASNKNSGLAPSLEPIPVSAGTAALAGALLVELALRNSNLKDSHQEVTRNLVLGRVETAGSSTIAR